MSKNSEVAKMFREIAFMIEMGVGERDSNAIFKARSYSRAADTIENMSSNIEEIYRNDRLMGLLEIPSVGKAIASKIEEYLTTGKMPYYDKLREKIPVNVSEFIGLEGVGPKTLRILYDNLQIKNLSDLEKALSEGKIRNIRGFSTKKEESILKRIQPFKKGRQRFLLGETYPLCKRIEDRLSRFNGVTRAIAAGSFRRMTETIGDIDYLVVTTKTDEQEKVIDFFVNMPEVSEIVGKGSTKAYVKLNNGMDADLLVVPRESFGSALQYFTGSKEHGVALRKIAISIGLHLNEWGIFDQHRNRIAGSSEKEVYVTLGLDWIPPEIRENRGEIELAKKGKGHGKLPPLIAYNDLKGDLQVHSNSTDGSYSIEMMALYAKERFGLQYIAITDHTKSLTLAHGLDGNQLIDQANRIAEINDRIRDDIYSDNNYDKGEWIDSRTENVPGIVEEVENGWNDRIYDDNLTSRRLQENKREGFRILSSAEVNILRDGSLDISNNVLDRLDLVGAAIHSNFSLPIEMQTNRLVKAAQNPSVDIIFHPTGRIINRREGYSVNVPRLIDVAKDSSTVLEIDGHYNRLDLKDEYIRMAVENGVKLVIDSDAHHPVHFAFLRFGIAQARRGWAKKADVLNTLPLEKLLTNLK